MRCVAASLMGSFSISTESSCLFISKTIQTHYLTYSGLTASCSGEQATHGKPVRGGSDAQVRHFSSCSFQFGRFSWESETYNVCCRWASAFERPKWVIRWQIYRKLVRLSRIASKRSPSLWREVVFASMRSATHLTSIRQDASGPTNLEWPLFLPAAPVRENRRQSSAEWTPWQTTHPPRPAIAC